MKVQQQLLTMTEDGHDKFYAVSVINHLGLAIVQWGPNPKKDYKGGAQVITLDEARKRVADKTAKGYKTIAQKTYEVDDAYLQTLHTRMSKPTAMAVLYSIERKGMMDPSMNPGIEREESEQRVLEFR